MSMDDILGSWGEQERPHPLGVWAQVERKDDCTSAVEKTAPPICLCCCSHQECVEFGHETWCKRLFCIKIGSDFYAEEESSSSHMVSVETVIRATLATRSHRDFSFKITDDVGINPYRIILVLLAEGEPPLTREDLQSWKDHALKAFGHQGTCSVDMVRVTSCVFRAYSALCRVLNLYWYLTNCRGNNAFVEGGLLYELLSKVRSTLHRVYGETVTGEAVGGVHMGAVGTAYNIA